MWHRSEWHRWGSGRRCGGSLVYCQLAIQLMTWMYLPAVEDSGIARYPHPGLIHVTAFASCKKWRSMSSLYFSSASPVGKNRRIDLWPQSASHPGSRQPVETARAPDMECRAAMDFPMQVLHTGSCFLFHDVRARCPMQAHGISMSVNRGLLGR